MLSNKKAPANESFSASCVLVQRSGLNRMILQYTIRDVNNSCTTWWTRRESNPLNRNVESRLSTNSGPTKDY